jgi:glycosyltransferase involved in cell wall biosynthesis
MQKITVVILTLNEQLHIKRAVQSVACFADKVIVVDSGSTDDTCGIARALGAEVYHHEFTTHARQLNWALKNLPIESEWVMKLDADEYATPELAGDISALLDGVEGDVNGVTLNLRRVFMNRWVRWGGIYPLRLLRIWRNGFGSLEDKLMDEHVAVNGRVVHLNRDFVDHNMKSLTWWTEKHNRYSSLEAAGHLLRWGCDSGSSETKGRHASVKRWFKTNIYYRFPGGLRAVLYFIYRYVIRAGFLDGKEGAIFHFLQAFWYRALVDAKVEEVLLFSRSNGIAIGVAVETVLSLGKVASHEEGGR